MFANLPDSAPKSNEAGERQVKRENPKPGEAAGRTISVLVGTAWDL